MKRYVIRHGFTGVKRGDRVAFGAVGPPIDALGRQQAAALKETLALLGIHTDSEPAAISELIRTRQTAEGAGFKNLHTYELLNEVQTGLPGDELKAMITVHKVPSAVLERAQSLLDNPPKEKVWITHGLLIIGIKELLNIRTEPFDPGFGTITKLEI